MFGKKKIKPPMVVEYPNPTIEIIQVEGGYIMKTYDSDKEGNHVDISIHPELSDCLVFINGFMEGVPDESE